MRGLDSNVLVRYLTQDDASQSRQANRLITESISRGEPLFLGAIVLCELVWVLRLAYRIRKSEIAETLTRILDTAQFVVEDADLCRQALSAYRDGSGDYSDYLLGGRNRKAGCSATATFDRRLRRSPLFEVI